MRDFSHFPSNLTLQKFRPEIDTNGLQSLGRRAHVTRKYNGEGISILTDNAGTIRIYTRQGERELTAYLPQTVSMLEQLRWPPNCFVCAVLYVPHPSGTMESTVLLQQVVGATTIQLGALMESVLLPQVALTDILYHLGEQVHSQALGIRLQLLANLPTFARLHLAEEVNITTRQDGLDLIGRMGWAGLVVASLTATHRISRQGGAKQGHIWAIYPHFSHIFQVRAVTNGLSPATATQPAFPRRILSLTVADAQGHTYTVGKFAPEFDRSANLSDKMYLVELSHQGTDSDANLLAPLVLRRRDDLDAETWAPLSQTA